MLSSNPLSIFIKGQLVRVQLSPRTMREEERTHMTTRSQLSWQWLVGILLAGLAAVVAGVLFFGGDVGGEIAAAACTASAWAGLHSAVPSPLRGKPRVSALVATIAAGLALKLYGLVATLATDHVRLIAAWAVIFGCCFVAGKPLTLDFGDVTDDAPPPAGSNTPNVGG